MRREPREKCGVARLARVGAGVTHPRDGGGCTPANRSRHRPRRSIHSDRMPAARAPAASSAGVSPTWSASRAEHRAIRSAALKIAGSGFLAPTPAEVTTPSMAAPKPQRASTSGSDTSQFDTQIEAEPHPRSSASAGPASSKARKRIVDIIVSTPTSRPSPRGEHAGTAGAQVGQRGGVASLVAVLAVVGHLGADGGDQAVVGLDVERLGECGQGGSSSTRVPSASSSTARRESWFMRAFSRRNPPADGRTPKPVNESFWQQNGDLISALDHDGGRLRDRICGRPAGIAARRHGRRSGNRCPRLTRRPDPPAAGPPPRLRRHPADRRRARAQQLRQDPAARDRAPRVERRARPGDRLRRASDDREHGRGHPDRDHAADPDRRHGDDRGRYRAGRRHHALLHLPRHRRRPPSRGPERQGHVGSRVQSLDRRSHGAGHRLGLGAAGRRPRARPARLEAGGRRRGADRRADAGGDAIEIRRPRDDERTQVGDEEAVLRERAHAALRAAGILAGRDGRSRLRASYPFRHLDDSASTQTESPLAGVRTPEGPRGLRDRLRRAGDCDRRRGPTR